MAYCIRCGVELQKAVKACPLCDTEVLFPDEQDIGDGTALFSDRVPRNVRPKRNLEPSRGFVFLATFILLVPLLVTLIIDVSANKTITWSFYPITSLVLLWILIAYPSFLKGHTFFQVITVDALAIAVFLLSLDLYSGAFPQWSQYPALSLLLVWVYAAGPFIFKWKRIYFVVLFWLLGTAGYLFAIDILTGGRDWFLTLGLPILGLVAIMGTSLGALIAKRSKGQRLFTIGVSMFILAMFLMGVDLIVNLYVYAKYYFSWSLILAAILFPSAIFVLIVNKNSELKAYLIKKFHI